MRVFEKKNMHFVITEEMKWRQLHYNAVYKIRMEIVHIRKKKNHEASISICICYVCIIHGSGHAKTANAVQC